MQSMDKLRRDERGYGRSEGRRGNSVPSIQTGAHNCPLHSGLSSLLITDPSSPPLSNPVSYAEKYFDVDCVSVHTYVSEPIEAHDFIMRRKENEQELFNLSAKAPPGPVEAGSGAVQETAEGAY